MKDFFYLILFLFFLSMIKSGNKKLKLLTVQQLRSDSWGSGAYGAKRKNRKHKGIDLIVTPGEKIFAPFNGEFIRVARPYSGDSFYSGALLKSDDGQEIKIFYFEPAISPGKITRGQVIGYAQNIADKYGSTMKPHIHVEAYNSAGDNINPTNLFL